MDFEDLAFKLSIKDLADQDARLGRPSFTTEYLEKRRGGQVSTPPLSQTSVDTVHRHRDSEPGLVEARLTVKSTISNGLVAQKSPKCKQNLVTEGKGPLGGQVISGDRGDGNLSNYPIPSCASFGVFPRIQDACEDGLLGHESHRKS